MEKNIIKFSAWQEAGGKIAFSSLAMIRLAFEKIRVSETARKIAWVIIVLLAMTLEWIVAARIEHSKAQELYEQRTELFIENYISQQEAAERGMPIDPREELRGQQATAFAKLMSGLKLFGYGADDFRTLAQCIACRVANPAYPNTIVEVIEQPKQWVGYSENNEVTQKDYTLAMQILGEIEAQERPAISQDYVFASFERDGITLRDTWDIGTRTKFWRYGE